MISGAKAKGRDFVYWTEVKNIPNTDLATIERLWQQFSGGKFGYSVQKVRRYYGTTLLSSYREKMSKSCVSIHDCVSCPLNVLLMKISHSWMDCIVEKMEAKQG